MRLTFEVYDETYKHLRAVWHIHNNYAKQLGFNQLTFDEFLHILVARGAVDYTDEQISKYTENFNTID